MARVAKKYQDELSALKDKVRRSHDYFKPNYDRYNLYRSRIFDSSLSGDDMTLLQTIGMPQLEFNIVEAYISKLLGEFSKNQPDIEVMSEDLSLADPTILKFVEQHMRHVVCDPLCHNTRYEIYKEVLCGFSGIKVYTDYKNAFSAHQSIFIEKVFDPTLIGFDTLAREPHKGDGEFCYELFPKSREEFEEEFPDVDISTLNFNRGLSGFNWSYLNDTGEMILVCDFYKKSYKKVKVVNIKENNVIKAIPLDKYNKMVDGWTDFTMPPAIIGKPREAKTTLITRYRFVENQVIEVKETDFECLPIIFVDGNSVMLKTPVNGNVRQFIRPYAYHTLGAQRLKNYAGISWANEIENTVQHKFIVAKEALPKEEDFLTAYKDVQKANVVVFNSVHEDDPDKPIANPIREVQRVPMPPEIAQAFTVADGLIQNILGSYDAQQGLTPNDISGVALEEGAIQSGHASMPYIWGYLQGWQRAANIYVNLIPKYFTTPRTLPVVDENGRKNYIKINQQEGLGMDFEPSALNVCLTAGASFSIQKSKTIRMVKDMMGMSQLFAQFISDKGLNFVLDNMEGRGIEQLKMMVDDWQKEMQQQKQMAMQQQQQEMQNNPIVMKNKIEMQKLQQESMKNDKQFQLDVAKLQADQQKVLADIEISKNQNVVQMIKAQTERFSKQVDLQIRHRDMGHRHLVEALETHHKITQKPKENSART